LKVNGSNEENYTEKTRPFLSLRSVRQCRCTRFHCEHHENREKTTLVKIHALTHAYIGDENERGLASSTSRSPSSSRWSPRTRSSVATCRLPSQRIVMRRAILTSSDIRRRRLFLLFVGFHFLQQKSSQSAQRSFSITYCSLRFETTSILFFVCFLLPLSNAFHLFISIGMIHCGTARHLLNTVLLLSSSSLSFNDPRDDQTSTEDQHLPRLTYCNSAEMRSKKCRRCSPSG
jgi:hypothetical protein